MNSKKSVKVIVAMSGGVDSSVSAALLKEAGFDVVGIMAKFWKEGNSQENRCCSIESEKLARLVAKKLGIPFYVVNLEREFKKKVVDYFLAEYKKGNTPNPCVVCNKEIKFGLLLEKARKMGGDFLATGHYAQVFNSSLRGARKGDVAIYNSGLLRRFASRNDALHLLKGKDKEKDQSYFLWQLSQKQLEKVLFPVGGYTKPQVREIARKFDLPTAENPESQEICFVSGQVNDFLKKHLKQKIGKIIDENKKVLGNHNGLWFYTIGQRKGIGFSGGPYYVVEKDFKKNNLIVSKKQKDLQKKEMIVGSLNWQISPEFPLLADVKIRYRAKSAKAKIEKLGKNKAKITFLKPQKAITSGQSAVFYKKNQLLGGGIIQ